jgi:hypothetical protein
MKSFYIRNIAMSNWPKLSGGWPRQGSGVESLARLEIGDVYSRVIDHHLFLSPEEGRSLC